MMNNKLIKLEYIRINPEDETKSDVLYSFDCYIETNVDVLQYLSLLGE